MTYGVVDLFCGVGGLTCGLEKAGLNVVAGYDLDASCEYTYTHNNGAIFINKNVEDITGKEIRKLLRGYDVKILAGCAPCQPFSRHQKDKKNRKKHKDWKLLYQFGRLVEEVRPHIVSMENVPELADEQVFKDFVKVLENLKYNVTYKVVNAADYGVPQKRERVIIVGIRNDLNDVMEYEFPKETNKNNWVPLSVAVPKLAIEQEKYYFSERAVQGMKNAKNNMKRGLYQDLNKPCLTVTSHLAKVSLNSRDPVLLVNPEKELYRRFTPLEAARIQSFPDEFIFAGSETDAYRQIGNAIPPVMFWHISDSVKNYLEMIEMAVCKKAI